MSGPDITQVLDTTSGLCAVVPFGAATRTKESPTDFQESGFGDVEGNNFRRPAIWALGSPSLCLSCRLDCLVSESLNIESCCS